MQFGWNTPTDPLRRFSPEFRLMLLCLQWPHQAALLERIAAAAAEVRDWEHLERVAVRHRVLGLMYMGLSSARVAMPEDVAGRLKQEAARQTRLGFVLSMETARLGQAFAAARVQPVFLKGAALTQAIYGNTSLRFSKDIDILVQPGEVKVAAAILRNAGFAPVHTDADAPESLPTWIAYGKAMDWYAASTGISLELHWRLTDLPLLRSLRPEMSLQSVEVLKGTHVKTLAGDALIAYLCVHGASHGWGRLKWLADVFALFPQNDAGQVEALYERMQTQDAGRSVAQALLLCHDLFGLSIGRVERTAEDDAVTGFLRTSVLRMLRRGNETAEVDEQPFGTTGVYLSRFFLGSGSDAVLSEARTWTHRPEEVAQWRLPHSLLFLLPLKRLGLWIGDRIRHGGRSSRPV